MKSILAGSLFVLSIGACRSPTPAWHPAPGPLMTRWGREVDPDHVLPEYPRPQLEREQWLNLNGPWQFAAAVTDEAPPFGRDLAEHILVPFPIESSLSGIARPVERAWYRRELEIPDAWRRERVLLHFGAVDWEARVFVNGRPCLTHRGGYDPFTVDITEALIAGDRQELIVGVYDPTDRKAAPNGDAHRGEDGEQPRGKQVMKPEGIWYTPSSGIWQTVWLEPVPEFRIESLRVVPLSHVDAVRIRTESTDNTVHASVEAVAYDHGREVGRVRGRPNTDLLLALPGAQRWSPDDPFLYDLKVTLRDGDAIEDEVASYFGMRSIEVVKDAQGVPRIALNGAPLFEIGVLDQGFWPDGLYTAPSDAALRSDIERMKELGFNLARKHVKVEPERWYTWCDRLGLLVWQDMPSGDNQTPESKAEFETELDHVIDALRNHPSIITWVVFNEGWGQFDTARLTQHVKGKDPSRLVSNASGWTDEKCGDLVDAHVYPGPGAPKMEPVRAAVLGEFGGLGLALPEHTWETKSWGYRGVGDRDDLTLGYEGLLRRVYELRDNDGLCAAVYTQLTDVETECNGLITYDREIVKPDVARTSAANRGEFKPLEMLVPTSRDEATTWRFRFDEPTDSADGLHWFDAKYDDSGWKEGPAGFGTQGTPGAVVRTEWKSSDIWLRRSFTLASPPRSTIQFLVHHDEDVEIYVNGVLAARAGGYTTTYELLALSAESRAALKTGANVLALHCKQTTGGQYIDVGIVAEKE
jgi:hypothetical protein